MDEAKNFNLFLVKCSINTKYLREALSIYLTNFLLIFKSDKNFGVYISPLRQIWNVRNIAGSANINENPGGVGNGMMTNENATNEKT